MQFTSGSPQFTEFIKKYQSTGQIVDCYSDEWLEINHENTEMHFDIREDSYDEFDEMYGLDYKGHLLIIYVDIHNNAFLDDLRKLYAPFEFIFNKTSPGSLRYKPSFLFINLAIRKVLCIGLSYRNRPFQFDAVQFYEKNQTKITEIDKQYLDDFFALDHAGYIKTLISDLDVLGENLYALNSLDFNPEIVSFEPNSKGLYEIRDGEKFVNKNELDELMTEYDLYTRRIEETIETIQVFFPEIEPEDLNVD